MDVIEWITTHVLPYILLGLYCGYVHTKYSSIKMELDHLKSGTLIFLREDIDRLKYSQGHKVDSGFFQSHIHMLTERILVLETKLAEREKTTK